MNWFKRTVLKIPTNTEEKPVTEKVPQPISLKDGIVRLNSTYKAFMESKDVEKYTLLESAHSIFLQLYIQEKFSFKQIKDGMKELLASFPYLSTIALCDFYHQAIIQGKPLHQDHISKRSPITYDDLLENSKFRAQQLTQFLIRNLNLLKVLLILSQEMHNLDVLINAHLPSCLANIYFSLFNCAGYILFDELSDSLDVISNIFLQLCSSRYAIAELLKSDTLIYLFKMPMLQQPPNSIIREKILPITYNIMKHYFTAQVIEYLENRDFIANTVESLYNDLFSFSLTEISDIIVMTINMLEVSTEADNTMMTNFQRAQGYSLLTKCLLHLEEKPSLAELVLDSITNLVFCGEDLFDTEPQIDDEALSIISSLNFERKNFFQYKSVESIQKPKRVHNCYAFHVLQNYYLAGTSSSMKECILESIARLYSSHQDNYTQLQSHKPIAHFIDNSSSEETSVRESLQQLFMFLVTGLNVIPYYEIMSICNLMTESLNNNSVPISNYCLEMITFLCNYDTTFMRLLAKIGFHKMLSEYLVSIAKEPIHDASLECVNICVQGLIEMSNGIPEIMSEIFKMIENQVSTFTTLPNMQSPIIKLMAHFIVQDQLQSRKYFVLLFSLYKPSDISFKIELLKQLPLILERNDLSKKFFRQSNGYQVILRSYCDTLDPSYEFFDLVSTVITIATKSSRENSLFIKANNISSELFNGIKKTNMMQEHYKSVFKKLMYMATYVPFDQFVKKDGTEKNSSIFGFDTPTISNPGYVIILLELISLIECEEQRDYEILFFAMIDELLNKIVNREYLGGSGLLKKILETHKYSYLDSQHILHPYIASIMKKLLSFKVSNGEVKRIFSLLNILDRDRNMKDHVKLLSDVMSSKEIKSGPFFYFDLTKNGYGSIKKSINYSQWPPTDGFTVSLWCYFDRLTTVDFKLLDIQTSNKKDIKPFSMTLVIKDNHFNYFSSSHNILAEIVGAECNKWYNICITHERQRAHTSETKFYVNAQLISSFKEHYSQSLGSYISFTLGTPENERLETNELGPLWRAGPILVLDKVLTDVNIYDLNCLEATYYGNFSGTLSPFLDIEKYTYRSILYPSSLKETLVSSFSEDNLILSFNAANLYFKNPLELVEQYCPEDDLNFESSDLSLPNPDTPVFCWPSCLKYYLYSSNGTEALLFFFQYCCALDSEVDENYIELALECLTSAIDRHHFNTLDFNKNFGYAVITSTLLKKPELLTINVLHLLLKMIGMAKSKMTYLKNTNHNCDSDLVSSGCILNLDAFRCFVHDYKFWTRASLSFQRELFIMLNKLLSGNICFEYNINVLKQLNTIEIMVTALKDDSIDQRLFPSIVSFIGKLILSMLSEYNLCLIANLIMSTFNQSGSRYESMRFMLIESIYYTLVESSPSLFAKVLDSNWMIMYFILETNPKSVSMALKILATLMREKNRYQERFSKAKGFKILKRSLCKFHNQKSVYYYLFCMVLGKPIIELSESGDFSSFLEEFPLPSDGYKIECKQALDVILSLTRAVFRDYISMCESKENLLFVRTGRQRSKSAVVSSTKYSTIPNTDYKISPDLESKTIIKVSSNRLSINLRNSTVGSVLKAMRSSKLKKERSSRNLKLDLTSIIDVPCNVSLAMSIPTFPQEQDRIDVKPNDIDTKDIDLKITDEVLLFIKHLFSGSPQLQDLARKNKTSQNLLLLLFPKGPSYPIKSRKSRDPQIYRLSFRVIDVISHIILDLVVFNPNFKDTRILDVYFEVSPTLLSLEDYDNFNNFVFSAIFENIKQFYKLEISNNPRVANSLIKFCHYCVDKIIIDTFSDGTLILLDFVLEFIQWQESINAEMKDEMLFKVISRIVLNLMKVCGSTSSLGFDASIKAQSIILAYKKIIFAPQNTDREFYAILLCLLEEQLRRDNEDITLSAKNILTTLYTTKKPYIDSFFVKKLDDQTDSGQMLENADDIIKWIQLNKKHDPNFEESIDKITKSYFANEEKYIKDRKQLMALNHKSGNKYREKKFKLIELDESKKLQEVQLRLPKIVQDLQKLVENHIKHWKDTGEIGMRYWNDRRNVLLQAYQVWGTSGNHRLAKWKLDQTENNLRMRLRLKPNEDFYSVYASDDANAPCSLDSYDFKHLGIEERELIDKNLYFSRRLQRIENFQGKKYTYVGISRVSYKNLRIDYIKKQSDNFMARSNSDTYDSDVESTRSLYTDDSTAVTDTDDILSDNASDVDIPTTPCIELDQNNVKFDISEYLFPGDKVLKSFKAKRICGLDKYNGELFLCEQRMYYLSQKELPEDSHETVFFENWTYQEFEFLLRRRYHLQQIAVEIFFKDYNSKFFVFDPLDIGSFVYNFNDRVQMHHQNRKEVKLQECMELWLQGYIGNFEYLMRLNTLAGRTYNDLTQYPVFPWVLSNYTSNSLDLNDSSNYRDLSKPMGALDEERAKKFLTRYLEYDDDTTPPFLYGSHYSSSAIVLHYLIRLEPFTSNFLTLQGGKFDKPDRLFHSVHDSYISASQENMMDVKELIPEFFYLPELFLNSNKFVFGKKQTKELINDVILPAWANDCPYTFVDIHRSALESPYVTENLHHWIDLIFGYKQRGQAALDAMNLFYYLTYEGAVDINGIDDPTKRNAILDQIDNFGQTPMQLFTKPHPRKTFTRNPKMLLIALEESKILKTKIRQFPLSVGQIWSQGDRIVVIEENQILIPPTYNKYIGWGHEDLRLRFWESSKLQSMCSNIYHRCGYITCLAVSDDGRFLYSGGSDGTIFSYHLEWDKKPKLIHDVNRKLIGHQSTVIQIVVSRVLSIVVSLDENNNVFIWDMHKHLFIRTFQIGDDITPGTKAIIKIQDESGYIYISRGDVLSVWSVNGVFISSKTFSSNSLISCLSIYNGSSFVNSSTQIITGHIDGSIRSFEMSSGDGGRYIMFKNILPLAHENPVTSIHVTHGGRALFSGCSGGSVIKWEEIPTESH